MNGAGRRLKVTIIGINYAPEPTGIAPYTTGLATGLAKRGHEVLVLTGIPHYPDWTRAKHSAFRSKDSMDGVQIRRFWHPVPRRLSWMGRAAMELVFGLQIVTARWGKPDVVICVSPPLLGAAMSVVRARLSPRGPATGVLLQDLYSRGIAEMEAGSRLSARLMRAVESLTFRWADGVSVIHRGFARDLTEELNVDVRRIRETRNWSHISSPDPDASAEFRRRLGWRNDEVVVMHTGNMGYKQGLENVIAAAALAHDEGAPVKFALVGNGNQRDNLRELAGALPNLRFLPLVSEEEFPAMLGAADVLLVNERPGVAHTSVPSKLTSYFQAGKPVLAATHASGFTAQELAASGAGICIPADRPDLLVAESLRLGGDKELAEHFGELGRRYCLKLLSEQGALDGYEQWIMDMAARRGVGL